MHLRSPITCDSSQPPQRHFSSDESMWPCARFISKKIDSSAATEAPGMISEQLTINVCYCDPIVIPAGIVHMFDN